MKTLIVLRGPMGAGKTAVSAELLHLLPRAVRLEGDWCWDMHPFVVTEETKAMVLDNISHVLRNFLACTQFEFVVFAWVLNDPSALRTIRNALSGCEYKLRVFTLLPEAATLRARLSRDVAAGKREPDILRRAESYRAFYDASAPDTLTTEGVSPAVLAAEIIKRIEEE